MARPTKIDHTLAKMAALVAELRKLRLSLPEAESRFRTAYVEAACFNNNWHFGHTAAELGVHRNTLHGILREIEERNGRNTT